MSQLEKLEWIHSQISELINGIQVDLNQIQSFIEDIRENYIEEVKR